MVNHNIGTAKFVRQEGVHLNVICHAVGRDFVRKMRLEEIPPCLAPPCLENEPSMWCICVNNLIIVALNKIGSVCTIFLVRRKIKFLDKQQPKTVASLYFM